MLARFLEEEGIPTTQISLVRLHTEIIKPPRALWVPFELGRPLGVPNNPAFQERVLLAALKLLEAPEGPVLADFPEDAPVSSGEPVVLACPYLPKEEDATITETERLCQAFKAEIMSLRPWYDMAVEKGRRTTVGLSRLDLENLGSFICSFLTESKPENPRKDVSLAYELRYAADDLKAYYHEAITAQPGAGAPTSDALAEWFWEDTLGGKILLAVREACSKSGDDSLQRVARSQIVPRKFSSLNTRREQTTQ
ncbi:MAG: hypothetical protein HY665_09430 [Chloroflexi bacterium]|nr:hypothetical protein [Chloroflexota bacterium]